MLSAHRSEFWRAHLRHCLAVLFCVVLPALLAPPSIEAQTGASWSGVLDDSAGKTVGGARLELSSAGRATYQTTTGPGGEFSFAGINPGSYDVTVVAAGKTWRSVTPLSVAAGAALLTGLRMAMEGAEAHLIFVETAAAKAGHTIRIAQPWAR